MQQAEARRSERIHYRGTVELLALGDAIEPRCVHGQAVDLGAGGMRVTAHAQMAVGSPVTCKLELDGRPAALSGRVAWARRGDETHGIGICFEELSGYDSALLQHMVDRSRAGYRAVELRFASLRQPILARARRRTNGLRLSAPLPIFARGSELSFRLNEEGPLLTGRIADASLWEEENARRIEVDVDVIEQEGVRFRRNARYGFPSEIERAEQRIGAPATPAVDAPSEPRARRTSDRARAAQTFALLPLALSILCGATVGYAAAAVQTRPPPASPAQPRLPTPAQPRAQSLIGDTAPQAPELPAPLPVPAPAPVVPQRPFLFAPEVRGAGVRTLVRLPLDGSLDAMRILRWTEPLALNFYLPNGRVPLSSGRYRVRTGVVRGVTIKTEGGEQLVRLKLTAAPKRYTAHLDSTGMLELSLESE